MHTKIVVRSRTGISGNIRKILSLAMHRNPIDYLQFLLWQVPNSGTANLTDLIGEKKLSHHSPLRMKYEEQGLVPFIRINHTASLQ